MLRTGVKIITTLRKYVNGIKTNETKTNVITDQNYIKKYYDTSACKVREEDEDDTTTAAPKSTTTTSTSTSTTTASPGGCTALTDGFVPAGTSQWNISFTSSLSPSPGDLITFSSGNFVVISEAEEVSQGNWTITTDPMPEDVNDNVSFTIDCSGQETTTTSTSTTSTSTTTSTTTAAPTTTTSTTTSTTTTTAAPTTTTTTTAAPTTTTSTTTSTTTTTAAPTTTTSTTTTTSGPVYRNIALSVVGSNGWSTGNLTYYCAMTSASEFNDIYSHDGSGTYPAVGDRLYYRNSLSPVTHSLASGKRSARVRYGPMIAYDTSGYVTNVLSC